MSSLTLAASICFSTRSDSGIQGVQDVQDVPDAALNPTQDNGSNEDKRHQETSKGPPTKKSKTAKCTAKSTTKCVWDRLTDELVVQVAAYMTARDLMSFQSTNRRFAFPIDNGMNELWKSHCQITWEPWPMYRFTPQRYHEWETQQLQVVVGIHGTSWKQRFALVQQDAARTTLRESDLHQRTWRLSFVLSGVLRLSVVGSSTLASQLGGDVHSDMDSDNNDEDAFWDRHSLPITFSQDPHMLLVPHHPPLPYQIVEETPPNSSHVRQSLRGGAPFSTTQWLRISDFPAHFITRRQSDKEWVIVNENVRMITRSGSGSDFGCGGSSDTTSGAGPGGGASAGNRSESESDNGGTSNSG